MQRINMLEMQQVCGGEYVWSNLPPADQFGGVIINANNSTTLYDVYIYCRGGSETETKITQNAAMQRFVCGKGESITIKVNGIYYEPPNYVKMYKVSPGNIWTAF